MTVFCNRARSSLIPKKGGTMSAPKEKFDWKTPLVVILVIGTMVGAGTAMFVETISPPIAGLAMVGALVVAVIATKYL